MLCTQNFNFSRHQMLWGLSVLHDAKELERKIRQLAFQSITGRGGGHHFGTTAAKQTKHLGLQSMKNDEKWPRWLFRPLRLQNPPRPPRGTPVIRWETTTLIHHPPSCFSNCYDKKSFICPLKVAVSRDSFEFFLFHGSLIVSQLLCCSCILKGTTVYCTFTATMLFLYVPLKAIPNLPRPSSSCSSTTITNN